jgi:hypothetical protein
MPMWSNAAKGIHTCQCEKSPEKGYSPANPMSEASLQKPRTYAINTTGASRAPRADATCRFFPGLC